MGNATISSTAQVNRDDLECVQGRVNFARRTFDEKGHEFVHPGYHLSLVGYDITIRNAHPIVSELSLDREGFILIQPNISCANEHDPKIMCSRFLEEMVPFIKDYFNASWVVPRRRAVALRSAGGSSLPTVWKPSVVAHIDYAPIAGPMLAAIESQSEGMPVRAYSRLMIIQAWHALSPPPQDFPLALCDRTSVNDSDIVVVHYTSDLASQTYKACLAHFNSAHRWYYFPEMTADELILFKSYDSEVHCNPMTAHSAFDNRRAYPKAKPRASIEARFFVYYA